MLLAPTPLKLLIASFVFCDRFESEGNPIIDAANEVSAEKAAIPDEDV